MFICSKTAIVSPCNTYYPLFSSVCFRKQPGRLTVQYEWVRSLAVSLTIVSCFTGDDNDSHCALSEIHRWHSSHSTCSIRTRHSCPRHCCYCTEAILNSWIILLFSDANSRTWMKSSKEREFPSLASEKGVHAWCLEARVWTAGLWDQTGFLCR